MLFEIALESLIKTQRYVSDFCLKNGIDKELGPKVCICCDEIVSNIINYSGASAGELSVWLEADGSLTICIIDDGRAFNPLTDAAAPDVNASIEDRKVGGLGIYIVKKLSRFVAYDRKDGRNVLTLHF